MKKFEITKEQLKKLHIEEKKTIKEIAEIFNCSKDTISRRLKEYGLTKASKPRQETVEMTEYKNKIKDLYLSGKTCKEIGTLLNKSERTISGHLKTLGIQIRSSKKINQEDFEKLWNDGKSDKEIADYFGVKEITIKSYRTRGNNAGKFNRTDYFSEKDIELTYEQEQFILGSLLGDLSIDWTKEMKNSKLCIVHSHKQEELFMKKVEILGDFMGSYKLYSQYDNRTEKTYHTWRGNSKAHKNFNKIYNLLYIDGTKTITQEYLDKINSPIALAYWFMDDGSNNGVLSTNCFSYEEVVLLVNWMYNKWGIKCTIQKNQANFIIYISQKSRLDFEQLIYPYMIPSMFYKLKFLNILQAQSVG